MAENPKVVQVYVDEEDGILHSYKATVVLDDGSVGTGKGVTKASAIDAANSNARYGCFPASGQVLTPSGLQSIAKLELGDEVVSYDFASKTLVQRPVLKKKAHGNAHIWEVRFREKRPPLRVTPYHMILTQRGWRRVKALRPNVQIQSTNTFVTVDSVVATEEVENVYNLVTTGEHNFIVDGIVAHNFSFFRRTRTMFHMIFFNKSIQRGPRPALARP